jgi:hypothetical protein
MKQDYPEIEEKLAYGIIISWWIFALASLDSGIALLTVSWQSWRAATRNPLTLSCPFIKKLNLIIN